MYWKKLSHAPLCFKNADVPITEACGYMDLPGLYFLYFDNSWMARIWNHHWILACFLDFTPVLNEMNGHGRIFDDIPLLFKHVFCHLNHCAPLDKDNPDVLAIFPVFRTVCFITKIRHILFQLLEPFFPNNSTIDLKFFANANCHSKEFCCFFFQCFSPCHLVLPVLFYTSWQVQLFKPS